jgi:hypothetical protein
LLELPAQHHELTEYPPEGRMVVAAEVGDGLEVRLQMPQQPDHLDVAMGLGFKTTAGAYSVQVAVDVQLQQIGRCIARPTRRIWHRPDEPKRSEVQLINKRLDEPHWIVRADIIVNHFR